MLDVIPLVERLDPVIPRPVAAGAAIMEGSNGQEADYRSKPAPSAKKPADVLPKGYQQLVAEIKERIRLAEVRAGFAVNRETVVMHATVARLQVGSESTYASYAFTGRG